MSRRAALVLLVTVCLATPIFAVDGERDYSFWGDGRLYFSSSVDLVFGGVAADAGGGQLAVAYSFTLGSTEHAYWRSVADASLGNLCRVVPNPGALLDTRVIDIAFDALGRLLVLARVYNEANDMEKWFALAFSFPGCGLATDFGGDGIVTLHGWDLPGLVGYDRLRALADGTTLVTGGGLTGGPDGCRVHVIFLEPDGGSGTAFCAPPDALPGYSYGRDSAVAANGHVVSIAPFRDFVVVDFEPDGTIAGVVTVPFDLGGGNEDSAEAVAATADGRIVIVGSAAGGGAPEWSAAIALLRWNAAGVLGLDPNFSGDGKLAFTFDGRPWNQLADVAAQGDGKILVAGQARWLMDDRGMAVARLNLDGSLDPDFCGGDGQRVLDFDVGGYADDLAYRVALQNGRIVLAGAVDIGSDVQSVGIARLQNSYVFADGFEVPQAPGWLWVD